MTRLATFVAIGLATFAHAQDPPPVTVPTTNLALRDDVTPPLDPGGRYVKFLGTKAEAPLRIIASSSRSPGAPATRR